MEIEPSSGFPNKTTANISPFFLPASRKHSIQDILQHSYTTFYKKGDKINRQGQTPTTFFYVAKGVVDVSYKINDTKITAALVGTGNFVGQIGFFDRRARERNIFAGSFCELKVFDRIVLNKIQKEDPSLYVFFINLLMASICSRFRSLLEEQKTLKGYAASLSTKKRNNTYSQSEQLPTPFLQSKEWHHVYKSIERLKAKLFDTSFYLQKNPLSEPTPQEESDCFQILDEFNEKISTLKDQNLEPKTAECVWGYIFKEVFPYLMRSRFAERSFYKPKGYAGDFMTIEMIYKNEPKGDGKLGILMDKWLLARNGSKAIRSRRKLLKNLLTSLTRQKQKTTDTIGIMNLACGSNRELFDFLLDCAYSKKIEAICVDIDSDALDYTNQYVNIFPHEATINLFSENIIKWALGKTSHLIPEQDIIYSSGLTDYLDDRLFLALINRCYDHLKPGGNLIIGNFSHFCEEALMDHILQWELIYREKEDLINIFSKSKFRQNVTIISEEEDVNLFAIATKSQDSSLLSPIA